MNILFISEDLASGNLAYILSREGNPVKLYIEDPARRANFTHMVTQVDSWEPELEWVGHDGLIVFDGPYFGHTQDMLRAQGYSVVGGSTVGDRLENERAYCDRVFADCGLTTVPLHDYPSVDDALAFVIKNPRRWVVKQNSHGVSKGFNYVGMLDSAEDVIDVLRNYQQETKYSGSAVTLQEKIDGVEIGIGRYFNGHDWVGPIEFNLEHKKYFPGDLGPTTSEMGTVAWYDDNETQPLFVATLAKLLPFLRTSNFRGDFEINCIVNERGVFPLEATPRFGSPITHMQVELHNSLWSEFLKAVADGETYALDWKRGYGLVVVVTVPTSHPFPASAADRYVSPKGLRIYFSPDIGDKMRNVHFEDVSYMPTPGDVREGYYYISDDRGYVLYVTSVKDTLEEAQKEVYMLLREKICIPKMFYRNDIGAKFIQTDRALLTQWGYLP